MTILRHSRLFGKLGYGRLFVGFRRVHDNLNSIRHDAHHAIVLLTSRGKHIKKA
jgi:hypothetical protein